MSKRDDDLLINDMIECCSSIFAYTKGMNYEAFCNSKITVDAVIRNFEIIGEASKIVSEEIKAAYPLIEFKLMTDFRNLLIHEYFGIDYEKVWEVINNELPYNYELLKRINL
jgi:uncharacterized protein with HEPN domain